MGTEETKVLSTSKLSEEDKKDLQFYLSIGENDRVKIVEGWSADCLAVDHCIKLFIIIDIILNNNKIFIIF